MLLLTTFILISSLIAGTTSQTCSNGGSLDSCTCQSFFTGPDCSTIQCINGGYNDPANSNSSCICPPGYRGIHCETVKSSLAPSGTFSSSSSLNIININLFSFFWGTKTYTNIKNAVEDFANNNDFDSINLIETSGAPVLNELNEPDFTQIQYNPKYNIVKGAFELSDPQDSGLYWSYPVELYQSIIDLIKESSLNNTAITIITQHIPSDNLQDLAQQMTLSFGIRLNVIWITDPVYSSLTDDQIANFKAFAESTGGFFVQIQSDENDVNTKNLVSTFLQLHSSPQVLQIQDIGTCKRAVTINFNNDLNNDQPLYFILRGQNVKTDAASLRACGTFLNYATSYDSQLSVFQVLNPQCSSINITAKYACSAVVFTVLPKTSASAVKLYANFIEDSSIDASRYAIIENVPFYAAVHIESISGVDTQVNAINFAQNSDFVPLGVNTKRISAFEWVSTATVQCSSTVSQYLRLNITVNSTSSIIRTIPINCLAKPIATTTTSVAPTTIITTTSVPTTVLSTTVVSTSVPSSTLLPTTVEQSSTSTVPPTTIAPCSPTQTTLPSLFFAYSTELSSVIYDVSRSYILSQVPSTSANGQSLTSARLECTDSMIRKETNKTDFSVDLNKYRVDSTLANGGPDASNVISIVKNYLDQQNNENTIIILLLSRLPKSSDIFTTDDYADMVNKNIKIFSILSISDLSDQSQLGRTGSELNKIASLTNGHYVIANGTTAVEFNDYSTIVNLFANFGYSQDLLYTRNIAAGSASGSLGFVNVPINTTLTVTLSFAVPDNQITNNPSLLLFGFKDSNGNMLSSNLASNQNYTNSNFYTASFDVSSGVNEIFLLNNAPYDALLRIWIKKSYDQTVSYADLTGSSTVSPNNRDGAALRLKIDSTENCLSTASITITDCSGSTGTKFDTIQTANLDPSNSTFSFVPYFCDVPNTKCISGTENKFDVRIVADGYSISRSFFCSSSSTSISTNCQGKDAYGNYQCSGVSPFKRGPTGKITDCSRHGTLFYDFSSTSSDYSARYECNCDSASGFTGASCEIANCKIPNNDGLSIENIYRTYTVVIGTDGTIPYFKFAAKNAQTYFGLGSNIATIWRFQLFAQCSDGQLQNLYSGGSYNDFSTVFKSPNLLLKCNVTSTNIVDLSNVYSSVVSGLGKNVRGAIVYYTEIPTSINVSTSALLSLAQTYQQQLFVVSVDETTPITSLDPSISQAAIATGGFLIQSYLNPDTGKLDLGPQFMPDILASPTSIAYVAQNSGATTSFDFTLENSDSVAYLITWNKGGTVKQNNNQLNDKSCKNSDDTTLLCKITGQGKNQITFTSQAKPYSAIVYVTTDVSPKIQIVSSTAQDISDSLSTEASGLTILSIYVPSDYSVIANANNGGSARVAKRTGCTFGYTSYSVFADSKYALGSDFAQVTFQKTGSSLSLARYFPIITSNDIVCKNNGSPNSDIGSCNCPTGFTGPDCSFVNCNTSATPNSWSDVCVCNSLYDQVCATPITTMFY
ncbi:unnamed protein product [Caenorhabditis angaria]|uniref:EGF-like domain-containing protein n=1 Tax=Caenorhabditis angaria TaxID=860376 RepID=A0A9P1N414_9PELO|nr:unnamed protein product [Caenorhabditis angaria]